MQGSLQVFFKFSLKVISFRLYVINKTHIFYKNNHFFHIFTNYFGIRSDSARAVKDQAGSEGKANEGEHCE